MRTAIYIRVSTEEQATEGYSIDAQKQRLTDFANSQSWEIAEYYIDDGYSAKDLDRPNVQRMISDIKAKTIDVVLVYRLDRLVRSVMNLHELLQLFDKHSVKFKSSTEMFDTTSAMGRFFITLVGAMAQWERENLGERVKMGMLQKHSEGERNGAVAPFGYDHVNGELTVNENEATIVKRIFDLYRNNYGALAIAKLFNREGIPKQDAKKWNYNTVYYIITNPTYCGKLRWNYRKAAGNKTGEEVIVNGKHEPLITEEVFNQVQQMRKDRAKNGKVVTSDYPFTGVLRCGRCGHAMVGGSRPVKNGRKRYYKCLGRFNYGICNMPIIAEDSVTEAYISHVEEAAMGELAKMVVVKNEEVSAETEDKRAAFEKELEEVRRRKQKWHTAYITDAITEYELKQYTAEERKREEYLLLQLENMPKNQRRKVDTHAVLETLVKLKDYWPLLEGQQADVAKKQIINGTYEAIVINSDATDIKGGPNRRVPVYVSSWTPKIE